MKTSSIALLIAALTFSLFSQLVAAENTSKDCPDCPEMVSLPQGSIFIGSDPKEAGRYGNEGQAHMVTIDYRFAMGKTNVTRGEFAAFVKDSGYDMSGGCWSWDLKEEIWKEYKDKNWSSPGYAQDDRHPAVCISWSDAKAYARWLSAKTKKHYRLPSESEWEYAARAGSVKSRFWGDDPNAACQYANVGDATMKVDRPGDRWEAHNCDDGNKYTSPVASFKPNDFGLYDMLGNAWQWTEDCYADSYKDTPVDGKPLFKDNCPAHALRGGSWGFGPRYVRSARRLRSPFMFRKDEVGFRVARDEF